jgi:hypothetical protein
LGAAGCAAAQVSRVKLSKSKCALFRKLHSQAR